MCLNADDHRFPYISHIRQFRTAAMFVNASIKQMLMISYAVTSGLNVSLLTNKPKAKPMYEWTSRTFCCLADDQNESRVFLKDHYGSKQHFRSVH
jgi:hypothetical protein